MGSGQSSIQVSEDGFQLLVDNLSGIVMAGSTATTTRNTTATNSNEPIVLLSNYYRYQCRLYPGSGRMMRTYRIIEQNRLDNDNSTAGTNNNGTMNDTTGTISPQQQQQQYSRSAAVLKTGWILCQQPATADTTSSYDNEIISLQEQSNELQRIKDICSTTKQYHVAPFVRWFIGTNEIRVPLLSSSNAAAGGGGVLSRGNYNTTNAVVINPQAAGISFIGTATLMTLAHQQQQQQSSSSTSSSISYCVKPIYMVRPYIYTTLADRLASRPFLHKSEKLWITYQILQAIVQMHEAGIVHGFLTTENIGITSTGWVVLMDIAGGYKIPKSLLPDDDPSEYLYYYQPQQHNYHHNQYPNNAAATTTSTNSMDPPNSSGTTSMSSTQPSTITSSSSNNTAGQITQSPSSTTTSTTAVSSAPSSGNDNNATTTTSSSGSDKRCYLAPERFYSPSSSLPSLNKVNTDSTTSTTDSNDDNTSDADMGDKTTTTKDSSTSTSTTPSSSSSKRLVLTPAMDIFSLGCVLTELFLNGERCLDLGELMQYRRSSSGSSHHPLQQKLNKIESSTIRAACKHMLSIDPQQRLTAKQYYDRLVATNQFASSFTLLTNVIERVTVDTSSASVTAGTATTTDGNNSHCLYDDIRSDDNILNAASTTNTDTTMKNNATVPVPTLSSSLPTSTVPDARIAVAASVYGSVLWECMGIRDNVGEAYFAKVLGKTLTRIESGSNRTSSDNKLQDDDNLNHAKTSDDASNGLPSDTRQDDIVTISSADDDLLIQVETMLKELDRLDINNDDKKEGITISEAADPTRTKEFVVENEKETATAVERSELCKSSLLIYLQLILSTIRHVQRPSSKLIALQLIDRIAKYCNNDEARLQRIVPVTISILEEDHDALVRAFAVQVLTNTVSCIQSFPPSDSKVFPQYILKRVANMISDPSLIVRIAFTRCIATLAETAQRFLDITHAVRLYEAVGNGTSTSGLKNVSASALVREDRGHVFDDHVVKLLDTESRSSSRISSSTDQTGEASVAESVKAEAASAAGNAFIITSSYSAELAGLHETVSRWVVHISTDQSEHSSLQKRALLSDLGKLCTFFGFDGVMSFILPHVLAFLNERKDWELRATLFEHLPSVCHIIGRAATEEFVLPCVEIGLVDSEERVISYALSCLTRMVETGMLSRGTILGADASLINGKITGRPFLRKYGVLLLFPAEDIRQKAIEAYVTICNVVGSPDREVLVLPQLKPFFRFPPQPQYLLSVEGMQKCLHAPWPRMKYKSMLKSLMQLDKRESSIPGAWTSIGVSISEEQYEAIETVKSHQEELIKEEEGRKSDPHVEYFQEYLQMLVKHSAQSHAKKADKATVGLSSGIEGQVKLAQSIMFPRQNGKFRKSSIPEWYSSLRDKAKLTNSGVSEASTIKTISTLGHVYGLSIMGPVEGTSENIVDAAEGAQGTGENAESSLLSSESMKIEAFFRGEWGSETMLDPDIVDTCLLMQRLKALGVPPLPPRLGELGVVPLKRIAPINKDGSFAAESKQRIKGLLATSLPNSGHTAPVVRLAMSKDHYFFVSASHDGTCRVWDTPLIEDSVGVLESTITYSEHSKSRPTRINDVAMLEGSHSIASAASDGSVHIWRVDMVRSENPTMQSDLRFRRDRSRVVGTSSVRKVESSEGEILAVSHFNTPAASIVTYASQNGVIHSWDLRCSKEPFTLRHSPDLGYMSSMALGNDLYWMVTGTNKGFLTLWDIRFQHPVKLWQHSRRSPISRLATSSVVPPQLWNIPTSTSGGPRPYIFVASGSNECAMFDATSDTCSECFRTVAMGDSRNMNANVEELPRLSDVPMQSRTKMSNTVKPAVQQLHVPHVSPVASINCMVGSIGASSNSYMVTGGGDCAIRFWDFWRPSNCYIICGRKTHVQQRPSIERIDFDAKRRLMLCREIGSPVLQDNYKLLPPRFFNGQRMEEHHHSDSIQDIKIIDNNTVISCSRDCTVKVWR